MFKENIIKMLMGHQRHNYENHYHNNNYNYNTTESKFDSFINLPLLVTIILSFCSLTTITFLTFSLVYFCNNYKKICSKICKNSPCNRRKRMNGIEIELGKLSHKIIQDSDLVKS